MKGYNDCILTINLSTGSIVKKKLNRSYISSYLGGEGYGTALLWYNTHHNTHSFSPRNMLSFNIGPLTGVEAFKTPVTSIVFISPLTNTIETSAFSGSFGNELKYAGYDSLILEGVSKEPVYICIDGADIKIKNASHLWGKNVDESTKALKSEIDNDFSIMTIGNAGERLSRLACIYNEDYPAGRYGAGALMGCKNVKAIAVRGGQSINIAASDKLKKMNRDIFSSNQSIFIQEESKTKNALYTQCGLINKENIAKFEHYAKDYGIDPLSSALTISYALKWYQTGVIGKDATDGLELYYGNDDALIELIRRTGAREGAGEIFADGLYYAALKIGGELTGSIEYIKDIEYSSIKHFEDSSAEIVSKLFGVHCVKPDNWDTELDSLASLYSAVTGITIDGSELSMICDRTIALKNAINYRRNLPLKTGSEQNGMNYLKEKFIQLGINDVLEES